MNRQNETMVTLVYQILRLVDLAEKGKMDLADVIDLMFKRGVLKEEEYNLIVRHFEARARERVTEAPGNP